MRRKFEVSAWKKIGRDKVDGSTLVACCTPYTHLPANSTSSQQGGDAPFKSSILGNFKAGVAGRRRFNIVLDDVTP